MNRLFISGSGGFIGGNLSKYFSGSFDLFTPRSRELDLCDARAVRKYFELNAFDAVIHCAVKGGVRGCADAPDTLNKNLAMFENIVSATRGRVPVIVFGSGAQYDKSRSLEKVRESEMGMRIPADLYGLSKLKIAEMLPDLPNVLCLNIFSCYGHGEKASRVPTYSFLQCLRGEDILLNTNALFDYLYIGDLCAVVAAFMEKFPSQRLINVTPTKSVELLEIANVAREISGARINVSAASKQMGNSYTGDNTRLLEQLPGFNFTPLREGMERLWRSLLAQR